MLVIDSGSILPATVVVELELNNVIPPPDKNEEDSDKKDSQG